MRKIIYIIVLFSLYAHAQEKELLYKDHLDYYSEHAKSTILTKDLTFLADGNYVFKGSKEDFSFLLGKKLEIENKNLVNADSIYLYGTIKDSVKVNQWTLKYKAKKSTALSDLISEKNNFSDIDAENIKNILHYGNQGKKQTLSKLYAGKRTTTYSDEYIYIGYYNAIKDTAGKIFTEREDFVIARENGIVKYKSVTTSNCGNYNLSISRTGKNISNGLDTDIVFDNNKSGKIVIAPDADSYRMYIKESYNKGKLTKLSIEYTNQNKGEAYFSKLVNNINYQNLVYQYSLNCADIR